MNQNSFQKNPFISNNTTRNLNNNTFSNYDKLGRKTVEEVKQDMVDVKYHDFKEKHNQEVKINNNSQVNNAPDFKNRINNLRNINRG